MTRAGKSGFGPDWPEALCAPVRCLPHHSSLRVALSGGMDSVLLLHVAARLYSDTGRLTAIHINHQLQPNADQTEHFCRQLCADLRVPLEVRRVVVNTGGSAGDSTSGGVEEAARHARYAEFEAVLTPGELLLMAHHGDDQAETVLFRLLRGTGVAGLGGMPHSRPLGAGTLYRPLLGFSRSELETWARERGFTWLEDPSNTDERHDRNFLRQSVIPLLKSRWPALIRRVGHSARSCREGDELAAKLAEIRYQQCANSQGALSVAAFGKLSLAEQKNLMRWWIAYFRCTPPSIADWPKVLADLVMAPADRDPELRGNGFSVRRYREYLYLVPEQPALPLEEVALAPDEAQHWGGWRLHLMPVADSPPAAPDIIVSTRVGGERIRPVIGRPSKSLKNWLQERAVPPWARARLPLLLERVEGNQEVVGVGDLWLSGKYCGDAPASGWRIVVERECN